MSIHSLSVISPQAQIAEDVEIGPFSVIEAGVVIGRGTRIASHVVIRKDTVLGEENEICERAVLGGLPQHLNTPERPGPLRIGSRNVIRENVTIHRSLYEDGFTRVGNGCLLMVGSHVAHDCRLEDGVILTNNVLLGGHVEIGCKAYLAGAAAVHQFCRVGRLAMVGGMARVHQDVPPFVTLDGGTQMVVGLNRVGLRRGGFDREQLKQLKAAYKVIYRSGQRWTEILENLESQFTHGPAAEFLPFFRSGKRGFVQERRAPPGATVRLVRDDDVKTPPAAKRLAG